MCLRFVYILVVSVLSWLRLAGRQEVWKDAEILLLRHQLDVLQRQQVRKPRLTWADRAVIAALAGVIPKAQRAGPRLLVTSSGTCRTCDEPWSSTKIITIGIGRIGRFGRPAALKAP